MATQADKELQAGDAAPNFQAQDDQGQTHRLADYKGRTVVLYFYPKDDTPGCTAEACGFRDSFEQYRKKGTVILGVSPDDAKSHGKFKLKYKLPFPLLADTDKAICTAYGAWKEKSMYGRKYMGVERSTFVIGPDGKLRAVYRKVSVPGHVEAILKAL